MRQIIFTLILSSLICPGCLHVGDPSPDELATRDAWSKVVSDNDRAQIMREAGTHTEWMEKRRVQWETQQFKSKYSHAQTKKAATRATTRASATKPSTQE